MDRSAKGTAFAVVLALFLLACSGDDNAGEVGQAPDGADVEPRPSPGCGSSDAEAGRTEQTLRSGTQERWYLQDVPPGHDGVTPVPVVVDLHGYSEGAEVHTVVTELSQLGQAEGFVTVTPHGEGSGEVAYWLTATDAADVVFLGDMLDELEADLCVDLARVYVTGFSNGAMMTSTVACALPDRVAAVAPVGGVAHLPDCEGGRAVPALAIHGTEDRFVLYEGGYGPAVAGLPAPEGGGSLADTLDGDDVSDAAMDLLDSSASSDMAVPEVMAHWAARNGCDGSEEPSESRVAEDVTRLTWSCEPTSSVQLYRVDRGGHSWPGSEVLAAAAEDAVGRTTMSVSANELMWRFFQDHALP